jgi:hypothetical protein
VQQSVTSGCWASFHRRLELSLNSRKTQGQDRLALPVCKVPNEPTTHPLLLPYATQSLTNTGYLGPQDADQTKYPHPLTVCFLPSPSQLLAPRSSWPTFSKISFLHTLLVTLLTPEPGSPASRPFSVHPPQTPRLQTAVIRLDGSLSTASY